MGRWIRRTSGGLFCPVGSWVAADDVSAWLLDSADQLAARDDHGGAYLLRWAAGALTTAVADAEFLEQADREVSSYIAETALYPVGCSVCGWIGPRSTRTDGARLLDRHFLEDHHLGTGRFEARPMPWNQADPNPVPRLRLFRKTRPRHGI